MGMIHRHSCIYVELPRSCIEPASCCKDPKSCRHLQCGSSCHWCQGDWSSGGLKRSGCDCLLTDPS